MKKVKAIHALQYGNRLVEPNTIVDLDAELADAFIASGSATPVEPPEVVEVADALEAPTAVDEVESVAEEAPHQPLSNFNKRGR